MSDQCGNCGAGITQGGAFKSPNVRRPAAQVAFVNFVSGTDFPELCEKCGGQPRAEAHQALDKEIEEKNAFLKRRVSDFPMFTLSWLPAHAEVRLMNMVTANITVGTGLFNEMSQSWSDAFGVINTETGMAGKVNRGEATARAILVDKALAMGANCLLAVDVDYGVTGNNAATVNMQATAAAIANLAEIMPEADFKRAQALHEAHARLTQLRPMEGWAGHPGARAGGRPSRVRALIYQRVRADALTIS